MKYLRMFLVVFSVLLTQSSYAQDKRKFKIHTIAFYNVENLFDTINDPNKFDETSPIMELDFKRSDVYQKKSNNIAKVISEIGADEAHNSPALIGLAEVENRDVLEDLANSKHLLNKDYGIVHYESPDARGIDVALLYQKQLFVPLNTSRHELKIYDDNSERRVNTRDQLLVSGKLDGDLIHVLVNHWPSRRGGEARSRPKRMAAAKLCKRIVDSLQANDPYAKILIMGDLNDNPTNSSVKKVLNAQHDRESVGLKGIYNPMENLLRKGLGTNAYRDTWSLFDQILITKPLLEKDYSSYRYFKAGIFNKNYLSDKLGRWKGYPKRSFSDGGFTDGYSDHFPVYLYLIKEIKE